MARIDEALVGREQREDNYRKWSERAIVVGYNAESQSYDIVITTERLVGSNKRTLNRTIRRVKSILDATVRVFLSGEAVTVGYLSDKREHPIILGLGDNTVQTPAKVTLGPTLQVETNEPTELNPAPLLPTPCSGLLTDSLTGSTTTLTVDCQDLDIDGCFEVNINAPSNCGCGLYEWSLSGGGAGFTISDEGALASAIGLTTTLAPFGVGDSILKICPPINNGGFPGVTAFHNFAWHQCLPSGSNVVSWGEFGCDSNQIRCTFPLQNGPSYRASTCSPCLLTSCSAPVFPDAMPNNFHGACPQPVVCPTDLFPFVVCDSRTEAMKTAGCLPCRFSMENAVISATDVCGRVTSISIEFDT